jgi:Rhs element Vgr protein
MSDDRQVPTSAPADRPSFTVLVNGNAISGEYQVQGLVVRRDINRIASAEIVILDGDPATEDFKVSNADEFVPGAEIEILAGYHGDEVPLFKGVVIRHGLRVFKNKPSVLRVECRDLAVKLSVGRRSAYYYDMSDGDVIEELAGAAGLETEVESTAVKHAQMVQLQSTPWDFIVARAEANGKVVLTDNGKLVVKAPDGSGAAVLTLTYGGNLLDFEAVMDARDQFDAVHALAWDAASQELLDVDAADPGAPGPGNVALGDLASVVGLEALELRHGGQLGDEELQAWADAQRVKAAFAKVRGRARIQGCTAVSLLDVVELGGVGNRFNGKIIVSGIRHEITTSNWETDIAVGLSPELFGQCQRELSAVAASGLLPAVSGLQLGLVTSLEDPDGEDRVQVRIPMIDPSEEGIWARVASLDAGAERGAFFRPEVGDEVVMGCLDGDPRHPVILGMLNGSAKPAPLPASDDNHQKGFVTRGKMKLLFDDDKISVTIETPNKNQLVVSDDAGGITLTDENDNKIVLSSDGIVLESAGKLTLKASGDVSIEGANVSSKAKQELQAEGSAGAKLTSGGNTVVKGAMVQIN